jgi:hypothetical protein
MKRTLSILAVVGMLTLLVVLMIAIVPVSADAKNKDKVTICHMPGTPDQKTMHVPAAAVAGHLSHGDYVGECQEEPLPEPPEPVITGTVMVTICHKPGTPAQKTLVIPEAALAGHLGHGDVLTPCEELELPEPVITGTVKVTICHRPGTPAQKTLVIPEAALAGHLGHGDVLTPCEELELPEPVITGTVKVTICHKPGTPAQKTLVIPEAALGGHLGHGDVLTPCEKLELPEPPEPGISGTLKITICHKPDTPAQKTLVIPEAALDGHRGHGDLLGPCEAASTVPLEWALHTQAWLAPWQPAPL